MMHDKMPLYTISNLKHGYNNQFMLDVPELSINRGSSVGFIGPNGSGKSTLFRILAFLEKPSQGSIIFDGKEYTNNDSIRKKVTLLDQNPYLLKRSVFENVAYGLRTRSQKDDLKDRVNKALEWVGLPPDKFANRRWNELSGGEAQRVALASRFILKPKVLLLDEPTSNIDLLSASLIKEAVNTIRERYNTTLIISSHDHVWLNSVTDDILSIYDGRIVGSGNENIITGPWYHIKEDLWAKSLTNEDKIFATKPPEQDSIALLHPSDIIISDVKQTRISAQNILKGQITLMTSANEFGKVKVDVKVNELTLSCFLTQHAVKSLHLLPDKDIWIIFKASSLNWQ
ncbi:MAG: ATP-binding cassette domain-containing protein [Spirochaetota bacterium]|nr:ATP-binding cassette domain-containing protein [Spirochaetota bacterium]